MFPGFLQNPLWRAGFRQQIARVALALAAVAAMVPVAQAVVIDEIRFVGNEKTQESTMLQEMLFEVGDDIGPDQIEAARQAIMDLGLFKNVDTQVVQDGDRQVLQISVDEKHYWFVLPRLSRSGDGDISYGIALRMHNLRGRNESLVLGAKRTELTDADLDKRDEVSLRYINPRLMGTPLEFRADIRYEESELDEVRGDLSGMYNRNLSSLRLGLSRWLRPKGPSQGWRIGGGVTLRDYDHELVSGDPGLYFDATVLSFTGRVEYVSVHDRLYSRSGRHFGYEATVASESAGSDASFVRHHVFYRRYLPVGTRPHTTLNMQFRAGSANRTVFGNPAYSLGGSSSLRGFERDSVEGNAYVLANVEYMTPLFGKHALRGVLFADVGNAYADIDDVDFGDMQYSAGFGLRWVLESFVRTELRLDFAHGFGDEGTDKVYASTKATF